MKYISHIPILYQDDFLFAVNKPPRLASVPGPGLTIQQTLLGQVQRGFADRAEQGSAQSHFSSADFKPYLLHRLDMETSGVILFGKHEKDRESLEAIFRHPETKKIYVALVKGVPSREHGGVIRHELAARHSNVSVSAETRYKVLEIFSACRKTVGSPCAFVEVEIKTGRKHQIRQHFAKIGHPVVLDRKYGDLYFNRKFQSKYRLSRQFLHAASIQFFHPFLKRIVKIEAPIAPDLKLMAKRMWAIH